MALPAAPFFSPESKRRDHMTGSDNGGRESAYQALRDSEELHRATLSNISDAVFLTDDEGAFTYVCPNVDVIFGYVPEEVRAMSRIGRLLGEGLFDVVDLVAQGEIRNVEREVAAKSGERRTVLIHLKRVSIMGGTVLYTCRDVTELKHAERELAATRLELAHAARLALVGQLMASIVHEVQQPLTSILANASAGLRILQQQENGAAVGELRETFSDIRSQSTAAAEIIHRLRTLVRKRPLDLQPLDVNEVADDVLLLVHADARRRGVTLRAELAPALPTINADRVSLQHVLLDLIVNAMDALAEAEGERLVVVRTREDMGSVEVAVSDTGHGIAAEHRPRVFDAFFTTKPEGIGLGLAIARSIVEAHRGRIWADEHDGRGATFRLALPLRPNA
jgi:PAS domain S-box-containing protein